mgnify:CR=1 FL=1
MLISLPVLSGEIKYLSKLRTMLRCTKIYNKVWLYCNKILRRENSSRIFCKMRFLSADHIGATSRDLGASPVIL